MAGVLVTSFAFLTGFLAIFGVNLVMTDLFLKDRDKMRARLQEEYTKNQRNRAREKMQGKNLDELAAEAFREAAENKSLRDRLEELVEQSGTELKLSYLLAMCLASAIVLGLLAGLVGGVLVGTFAALVAPLLPVMFVVRQRRKRLDKLRDQLPDALELMGRILRAGQTMPQAMLAVGSEFKPPIGAEFSYCYEQQNLGLSQDVALRDLAQRTGVLEIRIFVLGLMIHRRSGGNLTELLDSLANVIRERQKLRGRIRAMTAEGRLQAAILILLPILAFFGLMAVSRDYASKLLDYPWMLIGCAISMGLGALWIRKIVNFDF